MNIGLLEDNLAILELMKTTLELSGHTVSTYTQGRALLRSLFEKQDTLTLPYDLLIVDLNLPDELSGTDVITSIYRVISPTILPIIVVSAASVEQLGQLHKQFPALSIIRKPFALKVLLQQIDLSHDNKEM